MSAAAICLFLGATVARLPTDHFTLAWTHSIEKIEWQEDYRVTDGKLALTEARIKGSGAGMEPPPDAQLAGGWWHYHPKLAPLPELRLTISPYTADYRLCWNNACRELKAIVASADPIAVVSARACDPQDPGSGHQR